MAINLLFTISRSVVDSIPLTAGPVAVMNGLNAVSIQYETTYIETFAAVVKAANFNVNFNVYLKIVDFCSNQCSVMFSQRCSGLFILQCSEWNNGSGNSL